MSFWKLRVVRQIIATNFTSLIQSLRPQIKMLKEESMRLPFLRITF